MSDTGRVIFAKAMGLIVNEAGEKFLEVIGIYSSPIVVTQGTRDGIGVYVPMDGITETELAVRTHEYLAAMANADAVNDEIQQNFTAADVSGGRL